MIRTDTMIGKRVQLHEETWQQLRLLASESMKSFQELADEAFNDLLRKHGHPASLNGGAEAKRWGDRKNHPAQGQDARDTEKTIAPSPRDEIRRGLRTVFPNSRKPTRRNALSEWSGVQPICHFALQ